MEKFDDNQETFDASRWAEMLFGDYDRFYLGYLKMDSIERAEVLRHAFLRRASSYSGLIQLTGVRDADPDAFQSAAMGALAADARNISALRSLAWHMERLKRFGDANHYLSELVNLANSGDVARERLRNGFVAGGDIVDTESINLEPLRSNALSLSSYSAQAEFARSGSLDGALEEKLSSRFEAAVCSSLLRDTHLSRQSAELLSSSLIGWGRAKSVAVVGNGPNLRGSGLGAQIDCHDFVVRINYPSLSGFESDVGSRTDLVMFYEGFRGKLKNSPALQASYGGVPAIGVSTLRGSSVECLGVDVRPTMPWALVSLLTDLTYERATTGFLTAVLSSQVLGRPTAMYGFTFYQGGGDAYYFGPNSNVFIGHELDYEYWYCLKYLRKVMPGLLDVRGL